MEHWPSARCKCSINIFLFVYCVYVCVCIRYGTLSSSLNCYEVPLCACMPFTVLQLHAWNYLCIMPATMYHWAKCIPCEPLDEASKYANYQGAYSLFWFGPLFFLNDLPPPPPPPPPPQNALSAKNHTWHSHWQLLSYLNSGWFQLLLAPTKTPVHLEPFAKEGNVADQKQQRRKCEASWNLSCMLLISLFVFPLA